MPKLKWITALAAGVLAANLNASPTVLHGTVIDAADLSSMKVGVYEFNSESYQFTPVVNSFTFNATITPPPHGPLPGNLLPTHRLKTPPLR